MTIIRIIDVGSGETIREIDVTDKSIAMQEKLFDAYLHKTDLERFDVTMVTPEDK